MYSTWVDVLYLTTFQTAVWLKYRTLGRIFQLSFDPHIFYFSHDLTFLLSATTRLILLVTVIFSKENKEWINPGINSLWCTPPIAFNGSVCINHLQWIALPLLTTLYSHSYACISVSGLTMTVSASKVTWLNVWYQAPPSCSPAGLRTLLTMSSSIYRTR